MSDSSTGIKCSGTSATLQEIANWLYDGFYFGTVDKRRPVVDDAQYWWDVYACLFMEDV